MIIPIMIREIWRDFTAVPTEEELEAAKARNHQRLKVAAWATVLTMGGAIATGIEIIHLENSSAQPTIHHTGNPAKDLRSAFESLP